MRKKLFQNSRCTHFRCAHGPARAVSVPAEIGSSRRALVALLPLAATYPAAATDLTPFLKSSGATGFLAEEEAAVIALRQEKESQARDALHKERRTFEEEARRGQRGLCATPFGIDVVGIFELVTLLGALVGGIAARQRKKEAERLNEQLRRINLQLRQQARAGTLYAPGLSYAPVGSGSISRAGGSGGGSAVAEAPPSSLGSTAVMDTTSAVTATMASMDEETPEQLSCRQTMKEGKRLLRNSQGAAALVRFEKALLMSQKIADLMLQRRALRGMAASSRMQGNNQKAIKHLKSVLALSEEMGDYTGDADAYGSIADIYADMGHFEKAAKYYDQYINKMQEDGQAV